MHACVKGHTPVPFVVQTMANEGVAGKRHNPVEVMVPTDRLSICALLDICTEYCAVELLCKANVVAVFETCTIAPVI